MNEYHPTVCINIQRLSNCLSGVIGTNSLYEEFRCKSL